MIEMPEGFDSIFRYIVVVSQRAEQLINGARARNDVSHAKPTLMAKEDVDQDLVEWRILTQEELDAQRQAIVDQFHADIGADGMPVEQTREIPDVLPTAASEPEVEEVIVEAEGSEKDQELARLQRLLGMAGVPAQLDDAEEISLTDAEVAEDEYDVDDDKSDDDKSDDDKSDDDKSDDDKSEKDKSSGDKSDDD